MSDSPVIPEPFCELVHVYTRAQGIAAGVLRDVSEVAKEVGLKMPVALTAAAWHKAVAWTRDSALNDESGRLWDVLWVLRATILRLPRGGNVSTIPYSIYVVPNRGRCTSPRLVHLKAVCGPGDDGEAVITIMLANED